MRPHVLLALTFSLLASVPVARAQTSPVTSSDRAETPWSFRDVTLAAGFDYGHDYVEGEATAYMMASGVAAGDYDGDGWVDLFVVRGSVGVNLLFKNRGDGTFEDVAVAAGVATAPSPDAGPAFADIDGDGHLDLFVGGIAQAPKLFRNRGDGTFEDVSSLSGLPVFELALGASFADVDGDGDLDLFVAQWNKEPAELLWRNDGGFHFTSSSATAFDAAARESLLFTFTPNFTDLDSDGHLDLVVAGDFGSSQVLLANGDGTFRLATDAKVIIDENGMGAAVGDYDRDGHLDWFVTSISRANRIYGNRLYRGRGDGTFEDVTDSAGVADGGWGWGSCFADFNNDGFLDLAHVNGYRQVGFGVDATRLFVAAGDGTFSEQAADRGIQDRRQGRGLVCFDYDRDGDLDLFIANNSDAPRLYRNDGGNAAGHFLAVRLNGLAPNRFGIGARLELRVADTVQVREMRAGSHYASQDPAIAHFGLAAATLVDELVVIWPSGHRSKRVRLSVDQEVVIDESLVFASGFESGDLADWSGF